MSMQAIYIYIFGYTQKMLIPSSKNANILYSMRTH